MAKLVYITTSKTCFVTHVKSQSKCCPAKCLFHNFNLRDKFKKLNNTDLKIFTILTFEQLPEKDRILITGHQILDRNM